MWWVFALLNAAAMTAGGVAIKLASGKIGSFLGGFLAQLSAAFWLGWLVVFGGKEGSSRLGVIYSLLAGLGFAVGLWAFFKTFEKQAPLSLVALLTQVAVIVLNVVVGVVFFKESFSLRVGIGLVLALISMWLVVGR